MLEEPNSCILAKVWFYVIMPLGSRIPCLGGPSKSYFRSGLLLSPTSQASSFQKRQPGSSNRSGVTPIMRSIRPDALSRVPQDASVILRLGKEDTVGGMFGRLSPTQAIFSTVCILAA